MKSIVNTLIGAAGISAISVLYLLSAVTLTVIIYIAMILVKIFGHSAFSARHI